MFSERDFVLPSDEEKLRSDRTPSKIGIPSLVLGLLFATVMPFT